MSHGSTSLSLFSLSPCSQSPKLLLRRTQVSASSISSPKPFVKRRNHLRPKLLGIRTPTPPLLPSPPPPPPPAKADGAPAANVLVLEAEEALVLEEEVIDRALLHEHHRWFPGPVLDLGIKFAALLVVQTVVAVWVLGGGDGSPDPEERRDGGDAGEEKVVVVEEEEREVEVLTGFDKKVMEIRAMAKVARMSEEKDLGDESGVKGEVGQRLDWLRKRYALVDIGESDSLSSSSFSSKKKGGKRNGGASKRKRVGFLSPGVKVRDAPNGSKGNDECIQGRNI